MSLVDEILPIALIRTHCKLDDVPGVTDEQLSLYRDAAFEACERYTQRIWTRAVRHRQSLPVPRHVPGVFHQVGNGEVRLNYPVVDGIVDVVTGGTTFRTATVPLMGQKIPSVTVIEAASNCCGCGGGESFGLVYAEYNTGTKCAADVPSGIKVGCLKFIAWLVEHPGDQYVPVVAQHGSGVRLKGGNVSGSNNAVIASGAIDDWRRYVQEITY